MMVWLWLLGVAWGADVSADVAVTVTRAGVPGAAVRILQDGRVVSEGVSGRRSMGPTGGAIRPEDAFHLGSCTKAMTATLVARLVEAGVLAWDTPITSLLPDLKVHPGYRDVTLLHLLSHRAGTTGFLTDAYPELWASLRDRAEVRSQRRRVAQTILTRPPVEKPGTQHLYSNAGYVIVGHVIEEATGRPWEVEMASRVFAPLRMAGCGFGPPRRGARGHWKGRPMLPSDPYADNPPAHFPGGGVHCTLDGWSRFLVAHAEMPIDFLSEASWTRLHTPAFGGNYALGWVVFEESWTGGPALSHGGSNNRWDATVRVAPATHRIGMAVSNGVSPTSRKSLVDLLETAARRGLRGREEIVLPETGRAPVD